MKQFRHYKMLFFAALIIFLSVILCGMAAESKKTPVLATVLFFNDIHGHLMPFNINTDNGEVEVGGIARIATLVKSIRSENEKNNVKTILLFAGDVLQGTPMSTVFEGEPDINCFNEIGVDAMTIGNHEFDFGMENLMALKKLARFPLLSSNIVYKETGKRIFDASIQFEISDNLSLTVIGVTTSELQTTTKPDNVSSLIVLDSVATVEKEFSAVRFDGPVILLSHSRHKTDKTIAEKIPELAAIIGGHDQILMSPYRKIGNVPVFQAFEKGKYLGRIDFKIDPATKKATLIANTYIPIDSNIKPDPEIEDMVSNYDRKLGQAFKTVIGKTEVFLDGERDKIRYEETTLGNFVTDIMRNYTGAQVALLNAGSLRSSIRKGQVTVEDVFKVMPYANEIVLTDITGSELRQILKRSVSGNREDEDGGFLHVSGIHMVIRDKAVDRVVVGEKQLPLDPEKTYRVALTDFMASGGDGYDIFKKKTVTGTKLPLRELIIDTIRSRKIVTAAVEGRIVRVH